MGDPIQPSTKSEQPTILLVEDNAGYALLIRHMLREAEGGDYQLLHAERLHDGINHLSNREVELVLLDLSLPDSKGLETFDQLQAHAARLPVIILTGTTDRQQALQALDRGAQDYLVKDEVTGAGLVKAIHYAIKRKQAEQQIRFQASLLSQVRNAVIATDSQLRIVYSNRYAQSLYGWQPKQTHGSHALDILLADSAAELRETIEDTLAGESAWEGELELNRTDGSVFPAAMTMSPLRDEAGSLTGFVSVAADISERKEAERQLAHSAFHDSLTGLPNRALFTERLNRAITRGNRRDWRYAVMLMDLDRFKVINDSLGHLVGDELLIQFSRRVASCLRPGDTLARLGGDEFTILLEDIADSTDAVRVAERIHKEMSQPFLLADTQIRSSASIGITFSTSNYKSTDDVLRDADIAMYQAKNQGRGRHVIFERGMHAHAVSVLQREAELRDAVAREQLTLLYQPIVNLITGHCIGAEALLRWRRDGQEVPTREFLSMAEETGLVLNIGRWVLKRACEELNRWRTQMDLPQEFRIQLNLSAQELCHRGLSAEITETLKAYRVNPRRVLFEVSEDALLEHPVLASVTLGELRKLGIKIAINDFGSGFSSLRCLQHFHVDAIKMDRTIVQKLGCQETSEAIMRAIIKLAESLKLELMAVGIENQQHRQQLVDLGCELGQGYMFHPPLETSEMTGYLATQ